MKKLSLIIIYLLVNIKFAHAKPATAADFPLEYDTIRKIYVKKDATYTQEVHSKIKITNEQGRDSASPITLDYSSYANKIKLIFAQTINDNKTYKVSKKNIEDKPVASNAAGFDQKNRLRISMPHVKVGSILEYKYKLINTSPEIAGYYSNIITYGNGWYDNTSQIIITSEIPLYIDSNKLEGNIELIQKTEHGLHIIEIKQLRPIFHDAINENNSQISTNDTPWVMLTSEKDWTAFAKPIAKAYDAITKQKLPPLYEQIKQQASEKNTLVDKIHTINTKLSENIQYTGDWRTHKGGMFPRDLQVVNDARLADCKDYSTALVAILRALNINADHALVMRGNLLEEGPLKLANRYMANHVIVKITTPDNKVLWVDPTNFNSVVGINRADISNRHALVLNVDNPKLDFIELNTPEQNHINIINEITFTKKNIAEINFKINLKGLSGAILTGRELSNTKEVIEHDILNNFSVPENILNYHMQLPDLKDLVVRDLLISAQVTEKATTLKTSIGQGYNINYENAFVYNIAPDAIGHLNIGIPLKITRLYTINMQHVNKSLAAKLNLEIDTKWFTFRRKIYKDKNNLKIEFTYVNKVHAIYNDELKSQAYMDAVSKLQREYMGGFAVILDF
jgi:hypothetical protein